MTIRRLLCSQLKLSAIHLMHVTNTPAHDHAGPFSAATATQANHVKVLARSLAKRASALKPLGPCTLSSCFLAPCSLGFVFGRP